MKRREFLECAALLVGGVTASQAGFSLTSEQKIYLVSAPEYITQEPKLFTDDQRFLIARFTEVIIPETDTPGAKQAGVSRFIELMVSEWMNDEERSLFMIGLKSIPGRIANQFGKNIKELTEAEALEFLVALEEESINDPWYKFANTTGAFTDKHKSPFICQLKELTIWGFFTSEVGSTQVLRYDPMPMAFKGDIPLHDEDSSWADNI